MDRIQKNINFFYTFKIEEKIGVPGSRLPPHLIIDSPINYSNISFDIPSGIFPQYTRLIYKIILINQKTDVMPKINNFTERVYNFYVREQALLKFHQDPFQGLRFSQSILQVIKFLTLLRELIPIQYSFLNLGAMNIPTIAHYPLNFILILKNFKI